MVMIELAHSRPHSDLMALSDPQIHPMPMPMQSWRVFKLILQLELHVEQSVQCHVGPASVQILMNVSVYQRVVLVLFIGNNARDLKCTSILSRSLLYVVYIYHSFHILNMDIAHKILKLVCTECISTNVRKQLPII